MADAPRPTLGETGQIFVTYAAARSFIEPGGYKEHEIESARRALTDLLIDARQQPNRGTWRTRKRSTKLDISAVVEPEGRLQLQGHAQVKLDDAAMDAILKSHVIDPALLRTDAFNEFYAARKAALLAIVERAMGKTSAESASVAEDEDDDEEEGEAA
ncbi:MAG TPA: hypothetical protein VFT22_04095 [Kofleriaceae bacterium]|nr:hypothetical protein [Kofleriaceae bacterium]